MLLIFFQGMDIKKGYVRGSSLVFSQSYVKNDLKKKLNCSSPTTDFFANRLIFMS